MNTRVRHHQASLAPNEVPGRLIIETRQPGPVPSVDESLEFHAARILLLLKYAGNRKAEIVGRTKVAKMDFFLRYPTYLAKVSGEESILDIGSRPESLIIRYRYGPWDLKYYEVFALLVAKSLIVVRPSPKGDVFALTSRGEHAVTGLLGPEFDEIVARCSLIRGQFGDMTGTQIKKLIYD